MRPLFTFHHLTASTFSRPGDRVPGAAPKFVSQGLHLPPANGVGGGFAYIDSEIFLSIRACVSRSGRVFCRDTGYGPARDRNEIFFDRPVKQQKKKKRKSANGGRERLCPGSRASEMELALLRRFQFERPEHYG